MKNNTIDIFGTVYTIEFVDKIDTDATDEFVEGICESDLCRIRIATKFKNGVDIPHEVLVKNLIHELIHAILNEGQYLGYSNDEPLVEWLARCLYSVSKQGVFKDVK